MKTLQRRLSRKQAGATMVEYALMVALIAVAVAGTVLLVGQQVDAKFEDVRECLETGECAPPSET